MRGERRGDEGSGKEEEGVLGAEMTGGGGDMRRGEVRGEERGESIGRIDERCDEI